MLSVSDPFIYQKTGDLLCYGLAGADEE